MRILVVSKGSGKGTGASQATRYVARRKDGGEREPESEATRLFSAQAENLGDQRANLVLGNGFLPPTKDVMHLVISFAHEEDFLALGEDETARQQAVRDLTRATLVAASANLKADELRWVAGLHRNTDNPHIHLLIQRDYHDRVVGRAKRLSAMPSAWQVRWEKDVTGERQTQPGELARTFENLLEERLQQARAKAESAQAKAHTTPAPPPSHEVAQGKQERAQERVLLGRAMVAQEALDRLVERRAALAQFGNFWRFSVVGEQGQPQRVSEEEIRAQARASATRLTANLRLGLSKEERRALRLSYEQRALESQAAVQAQLQAARAVEQQSLANKVERAESHAGPLRKAAEEIHVHYAAAQQPAPLPQLSQAALNYLQDGALQRGEAVRWQQLETIRTGQSVTRSDEELARLTAQLLLAAARLQTEQHRASHFTATRQLVRWEIPAKAADKNEQSSTTLALTERALRWESDQAQFIGRRQVHWDDERRAAAGVRAAELAEQRQAIAKEIVAQEAEYDERIKRQQLLVAVLSAAHEKESAAFKKGGRSWPAARFTAAEMRALDQLAAERGDAAFYRTVIQLEREHDAQQIPAERQPLSSRASRAFGRIVMAEITERTAELQLQNFPAKREQTDVWLPDKNAGQFATARLSDVQPRSRLARAFPSFTTQSEPYQSVAQALAEHEQRLKDELTRATETRVVLSAEAQAFAQQFQQEQPGQNLPRPRFLASEKNQFAAYLEKEPEASWRERYAAMLHEDEARERSPFASSRLHEVQREKTKDKATAEFAYDRLLPAQRQFTNSSAPHDDWVERESRFDR